MSPSAFIWLVDESAVAVLPPSRAECGDLYGAAVAPTLHGLPRCFAPRNDDPKQQLHLVKCDCPSTKLRSKRSSQPQSLSIDRSLLASGLGPCCRADKLLQLVDDRLEADVTLVEDLIGTSQAAPIFSAEVAGRENYDRNVVAVRQGLQFLEALEAVVDDESEATILLLAFFRRVGLSGSSRRKISPRQTTATRRTASRRKRRVSAGLGQ